MTDQQTLNRRSFITRAAGTASALAGMGALLQACGNNAASSPDKVTLKIMFDEVTPEQVSEFQHMNPNIKIQLMKPDPAALRAMITAGSPPDLARTSGAQDTPNLAARGLATPLDSYFAKSNVFKLDDLSPIGSVALYDANKKKSGTGSRYSLAKDWSQDITIWYNKKVFDDAKVPYPDPLKPLTYDELLDLGKRVTQREGDKIKVYGLCTNLDGQGDGILTQGVLQQGASLFNDDFTKVDVTTPEARKVVQWLIDWGKARIGNGPLDPSSDWTGNLFLAGRVGILMYGYWYGGYVFQQKKELLDSMGFAPAPQFGTTRVSATIGGTSIYIPTSAKNKDAAWKFFEYYIGGEQAKKRAQTGFGIPAFKSLYPLLPQQHPTQKQAYETLQDDLKYFKLLSFSPYLGTSLMSYLIQHVNAAIQGKVSFDETIKNLQNDLQVATNQAKDLIG